VEQLAPFPYFYLHDILKQYTKAKYFWVQEEHENYGPWNFVRPRINRVLSNVIHSQSDLDDTIKSVRLIGRPPNSSPATGNVKSHEKELNRILTLSFE
jgi:2-oxoglutarate dehydrogenase E1 component